MLCSSCRRAGEKCSFCRIPLKRGPSKGQRRDSFKRPKQPGDHPFQRKRSFSITCAALAHNSVPADSPAPSHNTSPPLVSTTKPIKILPNPTPSIPDLPLLSNPSNSPPNPSSNSTTTQSPKNKLPSINNFFPTATFKPLFTPKPPASLSATAPLLLPHISTLGRTYHLARPSNVISALTRSVPNVDPVLFFWNDHAINSYYQVIHPTLPILPHSKTKLKSWLLACPDPSLASALLSGLVGISKLSCLDSVNNSNCRPSTSSSSSSPPPQSSSSSSSSSPVSVYKNTVLNAVLNAISNPNTSAASQNSYKTVFLVLLIFLFLFTDDSIWLGSAVSTAYSMNLHNSFLYSQATNTNTNYTSFTKSGKPISTNEDCTSQSRRLFLVLVILDCLNNASTHQPALLPEHLIHFDEPSDISAFAGSRAGVDIVKLCLIFRNAEKVKLCENLSTCTRQQNTLPHGPSNSDNSLHTLLTELEDAKLEIESLWDSTPILKAMYYSVETSVLAVDFHLSSQYVLSSPDIIQKYTINNQCFTNASHMLETLQELSTLLVSPLISTSALVSHFYRLIADNLCNLANILEPPQHDDQRFSVPTSQALLWFSIHQWDAKNSQAQSTQPLSLSSLSINGGSNKEEGARSTQLSYTFENISMLRIMALKLLDKLILMGSSNGANNSEQQYRQQADQLVNVLTSKSNATTLQKLLHARAKLQAVLNINTGNQDSHHHYNNSNSRFVPSQSLLRSIQTKPASLSSPPAVSPSSTPLSRSSTLPSSNPGPFHQDQHSNLAQSSQTLNHSSLSNSPPLSSASSSPSSLYSRVSVSPRTSALDNLAAIATEKVPVSI